jgi:hypothetical protein
VRQHPGDAFFVKVWRKQFGQRRRDGFERRAVADEMDIGIDRKARGGKDAFGGFDIGGVEAETFGQFSASVRCRPRCRYRRRDPRCDAAIRAGCRDRENARSPPRP